MTTILKEHEVTMLEAIPMLEALTDAGDPVMMWGAPGIGKSSIVYQLGQRRKWKVIDFRANIREPVDLRGVPVPDLKTGTTRWFIPDELPRVERDGEFGYLFLDEINTATDQMMAVMMQLVLERRVGDYTLPAGWKIIAAGNRVTDRAAARRMPTALRNRFAHIYIAPDVDAVVKYWNAIGVAPELVAFVRFRGKDVLHVMPKGDENAFPTPRSLEKCAKYVNANGNRMRLFATHIGDGPAAEFDAFVELFRTFGSLDDVIADPENAPVPGEPSLQFAVCTGLARVANRKNFAAILTYADRIPSAERRMMLVHDATERDAKLKETAAYGKWAVANQHLTLQAA